MAMLDAENLRTASLYINNQLLSRGLLRDGQNIDFADPDGGPGLQATMGKIMGVVNDLILRRDRDAVHRESLSNTLLSLRADAQRHTAETTRLSDKLAEAQRKIDGADATERTLRLQVKTTDSTVCKLKDEMAKMKTLVAQSRAACATEVRKRDRQIDSLKKAVVDAGRVRGGHKSRDVVSITVIGETGAESDNDGMSHGSSDEEGYNLRMETNEFLTELAKSLSEENSTLLNLVHRTVTSLREMSGLDRAMFDLQAGEQKAGPQPHKSAEELASELEGILEHLRTILTNPSFVPIEEVEIRETEIARLREGWERMEARWKDAVNMMDGWRRRMASSGKAVNMEELQMGMRLSPVRLANMRDAEEDGDILRQELSCVQEEDEEDEVSQLRPSQDPSPAESLHLVPAPGYEPEEDDDDDDDDSQSSIFQDDVDIDELEVEEPNVQVLQESTNTSMDSPPLPIPPQLSPLKTSFSSANRRSLNSNSDSDRKKERKHAAAVQDSPREVVVPAAPAEIQAPMPPPHGVKPQKSQSSLKSGRDGQETLKPVSSSSCDSTLFGESYESPIRSNPSRKLFSKPAPLVLEIDAEAKQRDIPRSQQPTQASRKKVVDVPVSPIEPSRQVASRKTTKRTASAPDASQKLAPPAEKPLSKAATTNRMRNLSPITIKPANSSRLPRLNSPTVQQSPITVAAITAKLEASERQADAARVREKLRAARTGRKPPAMTNAPSAPPGEAGSTDPVKKDVPPAPALRVVVPEEDELAQQPSEEAQKQDQELKPGKRRRDKKPSRAVSRRRSTLSPWELESLIQGNVEGLPSPAR